MMGPSTATTATGAPSSLAGTSAGLGGAMAFGFFEMSNTIPLSFFQVIVGLYLVEIVIISTLLASKIENGDDRVAELHSTQKALWVSIIIYLIVTVGVTLLFSGMANIAVAIGEF